MDAVEAVWTVGRLTIEPAARLFTPLRSYGAERIPPRGGVVLALNHFCYADPAFFGATCPRTIRYLAKAEAHAIAGLGQLVRAFGTLAVRRGESDREAVRLMRAAVRDGHALGLFVEGTRQRTGTPGEVKPGAAMVAIQEDVPVVPAAVHGSQFWRVGNWQPVSVAWGEPFSLDGLPRAARGYREGSLEIGRRIERLWRFLVELHALGRPEAVPPR